MPAGLRVENLAMLVTPYDERRFSSDAGVSGARVLVTLIYEMIRRDAHRGIAALGLGGERCGYGGGAVGWSRARF